MKFFNKSLAILLLTAGLFAGLGFAGTPDGSEKRIGSKAPEFALKSINGKNIRLADYKGKVVILDFWATWCPPCRKGIPDLVSIQKEFPKDVVIIGISLDTDTKMEVPAFVKSQGINYPIVFGTEALVKQYGGVEGIPTTFVIDKKGNIADIHVGLVPKVQFTDKVKELLRK
jgi:peroxiredoxin